MENLTQVQIKKNEAIAKKVEVLKAQMELLKKDVIKEPKKKPNPNKKAEYNQKTVRQVARVESYDKNEKSVWKALLVTSAETSLDSMGLSKAVKVFTKLLAEKRAITPEIKQALNFKNVCTFLKTDKKFGHLEYFTTHQIVLICSRLLKTQVASVKLSERVVKQKATTTRVKNVVRRLEVA